MSGFRFSTRTLTTLAMLTALEIVLSRFLSLNAWNIKIGFNFVPVVAAAILYGPIGAGLVAALGDFLGALLFPIGTYFPGFTLTAFLTGCVYGFFLYKEQNWPRIIAAVGINSIAALPEDEDMDRFHDVTLVYRREIRPGQRIKAAFGRAGEERVVVLSEEETDQVHAFLLLR